MRENDTGTDFRVGRKTISGSNPRIRSSAFIANMPTRQAIVAMPRLQCQKRLKGKVVSSHQLILSNLIKDQSTSGDSKEKLMNFDAEKIRCIKTVAEYGAKLKVPKSLGEKK